MFDPTIKSDPPALKAQASLILQSGLFPELLRDAPNIIMILNMHRQVVYLNRHPVAREEVATDRSPGQRPGECLSCINVEKGEMGCGSSEFCNVCGFNLALSTTEKGKQGKEECNISLKDGGSLTLSVFTKPFEYLDERFIFAALEDISDRKRSQMLENIFLHDIMNSAAILQGLSEAFEALPETQIKQMLNDVSAAISDEVQSYRLISNVETQTLRPDYEEVDIGEITEEVVRSLKNMQKFSKRKVELQKNKKSIVTERTLLRRVLVNMVKNAFEATNNHQPVKVISGYDPQTRHAFFTVRNSQFIPRSSQLKLFQKAYSTKGRGRGWGTYSIKVLTEKYLHGIVSFRSDMQEGTTFTISIPSLEKR